MQVKDSWFSSTGLGEFIAILHIFRRCAEAAAEEGTAAATAADFLELGQTLRGKTERSERPIELVHHVSP